MFESIFGFLRDPAPLWTVIALLILVRHSASSRKHDDRVLRDTLISMSEKLNELHGNKNLFTEAAGLLKYEKG